VAAAARALAALQAQLGRRSWRVARQARLARRALRALGGVDPAAHAELASLFDTLMARVVAPPREGRLPLRLAMMLLAELDAAAFSRSAARWRQAPSGAPGAVAREVEALGDVELALRLGELLCARPGARGTSEEGWGRRWSELRPHLEAHLSAKGGSLAEHLRGIDAGGDGTVAQRVGRMGVRGEA
jgi:hypothetical protein